MKHDPKIRLELDKAWWSTVPEQYKWAAMDADSSWYLYVHKPVITLQQWVARKKWLAWIDDTTDEYMLAPVRPCIFYGDWKYSLSKRPDLSHHRISMELYCGICDKSHLGVWSHKIPKKERR